jgi:hypothetical protein
MAIVLARKYRAQHVGPLQATIRKYSGVRNNNKHHQDTRQCFELILLIIAGGTHRSRVLTGRSSSDRSAHFRAETSTNA